MKRRTLHVLVSLATALLAAQIVAVPASHARSHAAPIDPEMITESISDGGVYIDPGARHFAGDDAKDRLRTQLEAAKQPVYVAVLPAGSSLTPAQLYRIVNRKGTFAVLIGDDLQASSNVLPAAQVRTALKGALKAEGTDPATSLVSFVRLTNGTRKAAATTGDVTEQPQGIAPTDGALTGEASAGAVAPGDAASPVSAPGNTAGGGSGLPIIIGGVAVLVIAIAAGAWLLWRRRAGSGDAGDTGDTGDATGQATG